jgi:hypothetical protein
MYHDDIKRLLRNHQRRLQVLLERKAIFGLESPVTTLTEIEDRLNLNRRDNKLITFTDIQQLCNWLTANQIDVTTWGTKGVKSVNHLWMEIVTGESQIQANPPLRIVKLVQLVIRNGDRILIEGQQYRGKRYRRYRGTLPSEKIKSSESLSDAAFRCLKEEMLIHSHDVEIRSTSITPREAIRKSQSYPELDTKYIIHKAEVIINELPKRNFWTIEVTNDPVSPTIKHQWLWVSDNMLAQDDV